MHSETQRCIVAIHLRQFRDGVDSHSKVAGGGGPADVTVDQPAVFMAARAHRAGARGAGVRADAVRSLSETSVGPALPGTALASAWVIIGVASCWAAVACLQSDQDSRS